MNGYLYIGDPMVKTTKRAAVEVHDLGSGNVALSDLNGYLNQQPPSGEGSRDSYGSFGRRPLDKGVAAWETFKRSGLSVTAWTGDVYALVELP